LLAKAVAAVKADKAKALDMFNKGEGGRDLDPFCFNVGDGKHLATQAKQLVGQESSSQDGARRAALLAG
jgi:hypothetical protein